MNRADERTLAWALVDAAGPRLPVVTRARLTMMIGAGELAEAIVDLLTTYASSRIAMSRELLLQLNAWTFGYEGTPAAASLQRLVERISKQPSDQRIIELIASTRQPAGIDNCVL
jgi:hypothetical protein